MPKCHTSRVTGKSKTKVFFSMDLKPEEMLGHLMGRTKIRKNKMKSILKNKRTPRCELCQKPIDSGNKRCAILYCYKVYYPTDPKV